jgi:hypothetical protein
VGVNKKIAARGGTRLILKEITDFACFWANAVAAWFVMSQLETRIGT